MAVHYDKNLDELTKAELIAIHIDWGGRYSFTKDFCVESTLCVTLRETRHCINFDRAKKIMPCLGSFALLDQVGNNYIRSGVAAYPYTNASGIKKALYYFDEFEANDAATKSLYAFRNALVHNASLLNERGGDYYSFRYDYTLPSAVAPAAQAWDGHPATLNDSTTTLINPEQLVELVSTMVKTLNECLRLGTLQTDLSTSDIISNYLLLIDR